MHRYDGDDKDSTPTKLNIIRLDYKGIFNCQFTNHVNGLKTSYHHPLQTHNLPITNQPKQSINLNCPIFPLQKYFCAGLVKSKANTAFLKSFTSGGQ